MALIELVDFNDVKPEGGKTTKKKRTRRAGKSTSRQQQALQNLRKKIERLLKNQKDEDILLQKKN